MGFSRQEYWSGVPLPSPPGGSVVKNPPASAGDIGLIPDAGRPRVPRNSGPVLWHPDSRTLEPVQKAPRREARAPRGRAAPCSPQLEKSLCGREDPAQPEINTVVSKKIFFYVKSHNSSPNPQIAQKVKSKACKECVRAKSPESHPTLRDPMDCSLPGSSVHGILQARTLEWVAMLSSRGSSRPGDGTWVS